MIRLGKLFAVLLLIWVGYWFLSAYGLRQSVSGWFDAQRTLGWQADFADISTTGFPTHHRTLLSRPALADPATGAAWQADWMSFESPAIWPGHQTVRFADTPQRLSYLDQSIDVAAADLIVDLRLQPGLALQMQSMGLTSGAWQIADAAGALLAGDTLVLSMLQTDRPDTYDLAVAAEGFTPGPRIRELAQISGNLPEGFETLALQMTVRFDRPWDRSALEESRPQPRQIDLALADLKWGALRLQAAGAVTVDAEGLPEGDITVKAENWREMLALARSTGRLPEGIANSIERGLGLLAGLGGNPNALDLKLNLAEGFWALGPIPLGPAPRLILR
jgi:hypothetical protein